jgi:hypothetical protein
VKDLTDPRTQERIDRLEDAVAALVWRDDPDYFGRGAGAYVCRACGVPSRDEQGRKQPHVAGCPLAHFDKETS